MPHRAPAVLFAALLLGSGGCSLGSDIGDATAPIVTITSPRTSVVNGQVDFTASVEDDSALEWVRFFVDDQLLAEDTAFPYTTLWNTTAYADGPHSLRVSARDAAGNQASVSQSVTVSNTPF